MAQSNQTKMAVLLVVGLVIGAGAGYMLAPKGGPDYPRPPSYTTGYDDGWRNGFADGKASADLIVSSDIEEKVDSLTTLVYGAIGASLISALAAIVSLKQISTRMI